MPSETPSHRLVVTSIGRAGFPVLRALEGRAPLAGKELAEVLFQAPGVLFPRIAEGPGRDLAARLEEIGLEVELQPLHEPFSRGGPELDLALEILDPSRMTDILREVVLLLGLDGRAARELLCRVPCLLVGQVSTATALALQRRFEPLDARVVALSPATALYDLYVTASAPDLARRIVENLKAVDHLASDAGPSRGHLIVQGLDHTTVQRLWELVGQRADAVRVIAQELSRFDLILDAFPDAPDALAALASLTGVAADRLSRLSGRLPLVLRSGVDRPTTVAQLSELASAGVEVHAELQALQGFSLRVDACPHPAEAARVVQQLTDVDAAVAEAKLRKAPATFEGPFLLPRARWLQQELTARGARCSLVKR